MVNLDLSSICAGMRGLLPSLGQLMVDAAGVCLLSNKHNSPVEVAVQGIVNERCNLNWVEPSQQARRSLADLQEATELGASAVGISLVFQFEKLEVVERSRKGTGFDYWLAKPGADTYLFQGTARLEVSGILDGTDSEFRRRVKEKLNQTKRSDFTGLPAYVAVVEFGTPRSALRRR